MGGGSNVDKLITIDTPHYGANILFMTEMSTIALTAVGAIGDFIVPLDFELRPESRLFTGNENNVYDSFKSYLESGGTHDLVILHFNVDMMNYMQTNQSPQLSGKHPDTEYYAIGGALAVFPQAAFAHVIDYAEFKYNPSSVNDFINSINNAFIREYGIKITDVPIFSGDNIVEIYSQFGLRVKDDEVVDYVGFERATLFLAINKVYIPSKTDSYHVKILEDWTTHWTVLKYIRDIL